MISLVLMQRVLYLFIIMFLGFLLVRLKMLKPEDSRVISTILLWLVTPCSILSAYEVDIAPEVVRGLILSVVAALIIHVMLLVLTVPMKRWLRFDPVETLSVMYSNAGNLVIPLVSSLFGPQWVVYCTGFMSVQQCFMWSHGKATICGEKKPDLKKIFTNVNMLAILAGLILFFTGMRFPGPVETAMTSLSGMIGPSAMLVTGMLIGGKSFRQLISFKRLPLVVCARLIAVPLLVLCLVKFTPLRMLSPNADTVLLITLIAAMTPSASSITQMAVFYRRDPDYASAINVFTTLGCILTMPVMVWLYQL